MTGRLRGGGKRGRVAKKDEEEKTKEDVIEDLEKQLHSQEYKIGPLIKSNTIVEMIHQIETLHKRVGCDSGYVLT